MKKNKIIALMLSALLFVTLLTPAVSALDTSGLQSLFGLIGGGDTDPNGLNSILDSFAGGGSAFNISDLFGGGTLDKLRESLGGAANGVSDTDLLSGIMSLIGGGNSALTQDLFNPDFLDQLTAYLAGENITTTAPETTAPILTTSPVTEPEPTTEPTTVEEPVTVPPVTAPPVTVPPTTVYSGAEIYTTFPSYVPTGVPTTSPYETSTYIYVPAIQTTVEPLVPTSNRIIEDNDFDDASDGVSARMIVGIVILLLSGGAVAAFAVMSKKNRE